MCTHRECTSTWRRTSACCPTRGLLQRGHKSQWHHGLPERSHADTQECRHNVQHLPPVRDLRARTGFSHNELRMAKAIDPSWDMSKETGLLFLPVYHMYGFMLLTMAGLVGPQVLIFSQFDPLLFLQCIQDYKVSRQTARESRFGTWELSLQSSCSSQSTRLWRTTIFRPSRFHGRNKKLLRSSRLEQRPPARTSSTRRRSVCPE